MIAVAIGRFIGLVLGLTGAGGSVFAVPLLTLFLAVPVNEAIGISLGAVSISALYGTLKNWRNQNVLWIPATMLAGVGAVVAPAGKWLGDQIAPALLLTGFFFLALIIAARMWRQASISPEQTKVVRSGNLIPEQLIAPVCRMSENGQFEWKFRCISSLLISGVLIGILTGLFGVGGGFLIVPILLFLSQVTMQQAVGTSLLVIAVVSGSGFLSFAIRQPELNWWLLALIGGGGVIGMTIGHTISHRVAGPQLQKLFAVGLALISATALFTY